MMLAAPPLPLTILAATVGAVLGSFAGVVAARWPLGVSFVAGRSRCMACDRPLGPLELVPLASWLVLRGRCRACGGAIPVDALVAEGAGAAIAVFALAAGGSWPGVAAWLVFGLGLLVLALIDARHFWLPDRLTLPLIALGLAAGAVLPEPPFVERLAGAALGYGALALLGVVFRARRGHAGIGGGDAKLAGAIGAWLGVLALPWVIFAAAMVGLALAGLMHLRGRAVTATTRLPFGTCLAVAVAVVAPFS